MQMLILNKFFRKIIITMDWNGRQIGTALGVYTLVFFSFYFIALCYSIPS